MKRILLVMLLTVCGWTQIPPSTLIANIPGRTTVSLNGTWSTIVDPYENGLGSKFYLNAKPQTKSDLVEYDFDTSPKLKVPGDWNSQRESLFFYEGTVWYQRYFSYEKKEHTRLFLHFGAANYKTRVWLNGKELGEHIGGFTPFDFEIKDELSAGVQTTAATVRNVPRTRRIDPPRRAAILPHRRLPPGWTAGSDAASRDHPVQHQEHDRAEDRHQPAGGLARTVEAGRSADEAAKQRARDAEQDRNDETARIAPGISSLAMMPTTSPNRTHAMMPIESLP